MWCFLFFICLGEQGGFFFDVFFDPFPEEGISECSVHGPIIRVLIVGNAFSVPNRPGCPAGHGGLIVVPGVQDRAGENARARHPSFVMTAVLVVDGRALQSQRK